MKCDTKGFTIIELLVIIAMIGIISAIAVPNFTVLLPTQRLNGAASTLRGDLYKAKSMSIKKGVMYRVVFTTDGYAIQRGTASSGAFVLAEAETTRSFSDYPGISVDTSAAGHGNPIFYPRGTATAVTVTLKNQRDNTKSISTSISGRVKRS